MRLTLIGASFATLVATVPALADNSGTGTVTVGGNVVAALTISAEDDLRFGELVKPSAGESATSVTLAAVSGAGPTYTNGGDPGDSNRSAAANIGPGRMTVTGEPNFNFGIAIAGFVAPGGVTITAVGPTGGETLDGAGEAELFIGGTMSATTAAATGLITGTIDVTVQYN